jgi:hypothetical protein
LYYTCGGTQRPVGTDRQMRYGIDPAGFAHHEAQIRAGAVKEFASGFGCAGEERMRAASGEHAGARVADVEAKAAPCNKRNGALVPRVERKRSASLEARKAKSPCESLSMRRLARDFLGRTRAIAPRHRSVTVTW